MPAVFLSDRVLFRISGPDAESFLQNLITTDIGTLSEGDARPGALLTPQGKILFDFMIWRDTGGFVIETDEGQRDGLLKRLTMYKLRAAVEIVPEEQQGITVIWDADSAEGWTDCRFAKAGVVLKRLPGLQGKDERSTYDALRIECGITASGPDFALQDAFPHDVLMDLNEGLSFRKGCYVGQEVVSRMQHRGTARRRPVVIAADIDLPDSGTVITAAGKPIGNLGTVSGKHGLAIVRIDRAGEAMASNTPILAGEAALSLSLPAWSGLAFPTSADEASA